MSVASHRLTINLTTILTAILTMILTMTCAHILNRYEYNMIKHLKEQ